MRKIPLGYGLYALVDNDDYIDLSFFKWHSKKANGGKYACRIESKWFNNNRFTKTIYMHRVVVDAPHDLQVHHINGNTLDNRKRNLELVTPAMHNDYKGRF